MKNNDKARLEVVEVEAAYSGGIAGKFILGGVDIGWAYKVGDFWKITPHGVPMPKHIAAEGMLITVLDRQERDIMDTRALLTVLYASWEGDKPPKAKNA